MPPILATQPGPTLVAGARIATPTGDFPVEALRAGDHVFLAVGRVARIAATASHPAAAVIRIAAGAFATNRPRRPLFVEASQSVLLADPADPDGLHAVPVAALVNGVSVTAPPALHPVFSLAFRARIGVTRPALVAEAQPIAAPAPADQNTPALARIRLALDARAGISPGPLTGFIDLATASHIGGWARDDANPSAPVLLGMIVDGIPAGIALAGIARPDLPTPCGFVFTLPQPLDPERFHAFAIRRATDGTELYATLNVVAPAPTLDDHLRPLAAPSLAARAGNAAFLTAQISRLRAARRHSPAAAAPLS